MAIEVGELLTLVVFLALVLGPLAWVLYHYRVPTKLRIAWRILRIDGRAITAAALLAAGAVVLLVVAWTPEAAVVTTIAAGLLATGVASIAVAVANLDWYRASTRLPVSEPDDVAPGPVQLEGRVGTLDDLVESSVTQTETAAYRAVTRQEHAVAGRGYAASTWVPISVAHGATHFAVVDEDAVHDPGDRHDEGRQVPAGLRTELDGPAVEVADDDPGVVVDGEAASYPLLSPTSRLLSASPAGTTLDGLERTVPAEPGTTVPVDDELERGARPRPREYSERRIDVGDPVYVLGTARETADGLEIGPDPDGPPFLVVRTSAVEAMAHARRFCRTFGLLGGACYLAGAGLLVAIGL